MFIFFGISRHARSGVNMALEAWTWTGNVMLKETNDVENTYEIITSVTLSNFTHITYVHPLICFFVSGRLAKVSTQYLGCFLCVWLARNGTKLGLSQQIWREINLKITLKGGFQLRKWECFSGKGNFRIQLQHLQATCFTLRVEHENRNREPETSGSNRKWSLNQRYERCVFDMKFLIYDHKHDSFKKITRCDQSFQMNILEHYRCSNRQFPHRAATSCWIPASRLIRLWNNYLKYVRLENGKQCLRVLQQWLDFVGKMNSNPWVIRRSFPHHLGALSRTMRRLKRSSAQKSWRVLLILRWVCGSALNKLCSRKRLLENLLH